MTKLKSVASVKLDQTKYRRKSGCLSLNHQDKISISKTISCVENVKDTVASSDNSPLTINLILVSANVD